MMAGGGEAAAPAVGSTCSPPTVNGDGAVGSGQQGPRQLVSDEMLYKLSKKIAQLTKVIYSLNTKNDDLEMDMEVLRNGYEDKLQKAHTEYNQMREMVHHYQAKVSQELLPGEEVKRKEGEELKKELRKARHQLKQYELKIKSIEEEQKQQVANQLASKERSSPRPAELNLRSQLEATQTQLDRERSEHRRRLELLEAQLETGSLDNQMLRSTVDELRRDKESLRHQLSASRAEVAARAEDSQRQDLVDRLAADNAALQLAIKAAEEQRQEEADRLAAVTAAMEEQRRQEELTVAHLKCEAAQYEKSLTDIREYYEAKIRTLVEEKTACATNFDQMKRHFEAEVKHFKQLAARREDELGCLKAEVLQIKEDLIGQEPRHRAALAELSERLRTSEAAAQQAEAELAAGQLALVTSQEREGALSQQVEVGERELAQLRETVLRLQREMGQANEKLTGIEDRFRGVETERDSLKKKLKETEIRVEVLGKKQAEDQTRDQHVQELECALEEALVEREQILEACEKEIEQERNIAIELEQKLMEDFEWKLREIEGGYKTKIKTLEDSIGGRLREQEREITRRKDAELTKMCIDARRDMEDRLKEERNSLKAALEAAARSEKEAAVSQITLQKEREQRLLQRGWDDERSRLERELKRLQAHTDQEVAAQVGRMRSEADQRLFETNRKHAQIVEKCQADYEALKEEMEGRMNRMRAEHAEQVEEYQAKVAGLLSGKVDTILQLKEEVEVEFSDRMSGLRDMYRKEMEQQMDLHNTQMEKWKELERCLNLKLEEKKQECEDNIAYYTQREAEFEAKIDELMTRLQDQTAAYMKLQAEFDNYEWWEEGEEEKEKERRGSSRESLLQQGARSRPATRPPTREEVHWMAETVEDNEEEEEEEQVVVMVNDGSGELANQGAFNGHAASLGVEEEEEVAAAAAEPEVPPRRLEKAEEQQRASWLEDGQSTKRSSTSSSRSNRRSNCSQQ